MQATKADGSVVEFDAVLRIDTPGEADYYRNGGILQYVLRQLPADDPPDGPCLPTAPPTPHVWTPSRHHAGPVTPSMGHGSSKGSSSLDVGGGGGRERRAGSLGSAA